MARSQRHAVYIKGVDAAGKGVAEGVAAPVYVQQFIASQALTVPLGPPSGPLKGSNLAGFPPTALPGPKEGDEARATVEGDALTDPGQLNLSGNPHYISLPPAGGTAPEPPDPELAPTLDSLDPNTAVLGSEDITLRCLGSNFTEDSIINFAGQPEPIVFVSAGEITTGVKPSLGWGVVTVPVFVQNADGQIAHPPLDFTFTEAEPELEGEAAPAPVKRKSRARSAS
jgi:IPT/TIG domain